jgi:hypothetical protein
MSRFMILFFFSGWYLPKFQSETNFGNIVSMMNLYILYIVVFTVRELSDNDIIEYPIIV